MRHHCKVAAICAAYSRKPHRRAVRVSRIGVVAVSYGRFAIAEELLGIGKCAILNNLARETEASLSVCNPDAERAALQRFKHNGWRLLYMHASKAALKFS